MSNAIEAKFVRGDGSSGRELHCQVDERNRVSWQEIPVGEKGISVPFESIDEARGFMSRYARLMGYLRKEAE